MKCLKRINDITEDWISGGGIFTALNTVSPLPFPEGIALSLDIEYYGNVSGNKIVSPLLDNIVTGDTISSEEMAIICDIIIATCYQRWTKLFATFSLEYNPIENYSMVEEMTDDETVHEYGKVNTRTDTGSDTQEGSIYGFNSTNPSNADKQVMTLGETHTDTGSGSDTDTRNYTLTRAGNIGVTTSQQMIESERNLWLWDFFHKVVFPDVDRILTISIY